MICNLCPRNCKANRNETENIGGYCKSPIIPKVARADLHFFEEPVISGKNGSGAVFFSGCSLGCIYCQNGDISQNLYGKSVDAKELSEIFKKLEDRGAHNINLVTPTHYVNTVIDALSVYKPSIPIVYNSSGYEKVETLKSLQNFIDIYLLDFKYIDPLKAKKYSYAEDYPEYAKNALLEAYRQKGEAIIKDNIMQSGVIVRHLLLPQATNDAIKIFEFVKNNTNGVYFSLMSQYVPCGKALDDKIISRKITKREYDKVVSVITDSGFDNCFIQDLSSADMSYTPKFDLTGV